MALEYRKTDVPAFAIRAEPEPPLAWSWSLGMPALTQPCEKPAARVLEEHETCNRTSWPVP